MGLKDPTKLSLDFDLLIFKIVHLHLKFTLSTPTTVSRRSVPTIVNYVTTALFREGM